MDWAVIAGNVPLAANRNGPAVSRTIYILQWTISYEGSDAEQALY
jgi:hypothetical protein